MRGRGRSALASHAEAAIRSRKRWENGTYVLDLLGDELGEGLLEGLCLGGVGSREAGGGRGLQRRTREQGRGEGEQAEEDESGRERAGGTVRREQRKCEQAVNSESAVRVLRTWVRRSDRTAAIVVDEGMVLREERGRARRRVWRSLSGDPAPAFGRAAAQPPGPVALSPRPASSAASIYALAHASFAFSASLTPVFPSTQTLLEGLLSPPVACVFDARAGRARIDGSGGF